MNEQEHIYIKSIRSEGIINKEYKHKSILKSELKDFVRNELEITTNTTGWTLDSWTKEAENARILPFDLYTLTYISPINQEAIYVIVECE